MRCPPLRAPQQCGTFFLIKVIKNCIAFVWASQKCASHFYEGLQNVHLLFMSVPKFCSAVYEGHKQLHLLCMSASTMCITVLWRPQQCASPFLWVCQPFASLFMKVWAIHISFTWASQKCASRIYEGLKKCASPFYESFKNLHQDLWRS